MAPHGSFRSSSPRNPGGPGFKATTGIEPVERSHRPRRWWPRHAFSGPLTAPDTDPGGPAYLACQAGAHGVTRRWTLVVVDSQAWLIERASR